MATADIAAEATGVVLVSGIVTLPKKSTDTFAAGGKIYWDATEGYVTTTSESNTFAGYYLEADGSQRCSSSAALAPCGAICRHLPC